MQVIEYRSAVINFAGAPTSTAGQWQHDQEIKHMAKDVFMTELYA